MNRIKQYRNTIGVNQKTIGDLVGVDQSSINRYETGERKPSIEMGWKIVKVFNCLGCNCSFNDVFPDPKTNHTESTQ
ncbi:MAG: helix-turn-helix transcriptional regulator [Vibrio sp.]